MASLQNFDRKNITSIEVVQKGDRLVVDSRLIADDLGIEHESFMRTIKKYETRIEQRFGIIRFSRGEIKGSGRPQQFAWLTEDVAKFLISKSRHGLSHSSIEKFRQMGFDFSSFLRGELCRRKQKESDYSNGLADKLNGKREVRTLAGSIDVLTSTEIIEVKNVNSWKSAMGQVLVYGHYYPSHQKRIHLYGETQESFLAMIKSHCSLFDIDVTWEA